MTQLRPAAALLLLLAVAGCGASVAPARRLAAPLGPAGGEVRVLEPPPGRAAGPLPVVYFLHDILGSDAVLWEHGVAQRLLARQASGELPPFLLVAPEGGRSFWTDAWDGRRLYETWVSRDLPAWTAARWPVRAGRAGRAYVGISMGGFGAVKVGLRRPQETAVVVSISGMLVPLDPAFVRQRNPLLRRSLGSVFGPGGDAGTLRRNDPYRLLAGLEELPAGPRPRLLLLAGQQDKYHLDRAADLFGGLAREKGLRAEVRLAPGGHDWDYWTRSAEEGIAWAVRALQEEAGS